MAPRAYWKGYLKLSLVSCPIALYPATSEREKIGFNQLNKETGNRIRYRKVDAETGDDVEQSNIIKGYEVAKGQYIELAPDELEAVAIESKRTIDIDEFVPKSQIDELLLQRKNQYAKAASNCSTAQSISPWVTTRGGLTRIMWSWVSLHRTPRRRSASQ